MLDKLYSLHFHILGAGQALCGPAGGTCDLGPLPTTGAGQGQLNSILKIVFGSLAALAVLMVTISAFRFITAQGNPQDMARARSALIYSLVGLGVSLSAVAIVGFVLNKI